MSDIKYDFSQLSSGQQDMNAGATRIDDILENLGGQIRPLVESFVGDASTSYYAAQHKWDSLSMNLNQLFAQASAQVGTSAENMANSDRSSAGLFR